MRVAVMSVVPTLGKTALIEVLGGVYSRSQGRTVAVFSTGNAVDNIEMITNISRNDKLDNPYVVKALIENAYEEPEALLNYGVQAGDERVFIFDILNNVMSREEKYEFLEEAIKTIPADLSLIEIVGDVESDLNKRVMELCDCAIILTDSSQKGIRLLGELRGKLPKGNMQLNQAIVLSRINPLVVSDKKFAEKSKLKTMNIFKFPYSPVVGKLALDGELDTIVYNILSGDHEVVNFRVPMQELMEFLFNTPTRKIVRSIDRWYK